MLAPEGFDLRLDSHDFIQATDSDKHVQNALLRVANYLSNHDRLAVLPSLHPSFFNCHRNVCGVVGFPTNLESLNESLLQFFRGQICHLQSQL
jgi:hypothetical protein